MIAVKYLWINCEELSEPHSTALCLSNVSDVFEIFHLRLSNPQRFEGRICLRLQMEKERGNLLWWPHYKEFVSVYCSNITVYLLYAFRCQVVCCLYSKHILGVASWTSFKNCTVGTNLGKSHALITILPILWPLISVHPTTIV